MMKKILELMTPFEYVAWTAAEPIRKSPHLFEIFLSV